MKKIFLLVSFWILIVTSYANIAQSPYSRGGDLIGNSPMKDITILHEDLEIDMSNYTQWSHLIKVTATYKLYCPHSVDTLNLIFIANDLRASSYLVFLDKKNINGRGVELDKIPTSWLPTESIKGNNEYIPYHYYSRGLISFSLDSLAEGIHLLTVSYTADASPWFSDKTNTLYSSLVYILKPTDAWKEFDTLDLLVKLPVDWQYISNLDMTEENTTHILYQRWKTLPATYFSIALSKSLTVEKITSVLFIILCLALVAFLIYRWFLYVTKYKVRNKEPLRIQIWQSICIAVACSIFVPMGIIGGNDSLINLVSGGVQNPYSDIGRGAVYFFVFGFPFVFTFALVCIIIINYIAIMRVKYKIS